MLRRDLIRGLWPDKTMQAGLMVLLASGASLLFYAQRALFEIRFAESVPSLLRAEPTQVMAFLALVAGILAFVAIKRKHVAWGWTAVAVSALSVGPLAMGLLVAVVAAGFLVFAQAEREHKNPRTRSMHSMEWPDKAFAAGLVLLVAGVASLVWGVALMVGALEITIVPPMVLGALSILSSGVSFWAARELRRERGFGVGLLACGLAIASLGLFVLAPLLALVGLVLLLLAKREGEFEPAPAQAPSEVAVTPAEP